MVSDSRRVVFITGAAGGIGRALVSKFYNEDWNLVLQARGSSDLRDVVQTLQIEESRISLQNYEVSDSKAMNRAMVESYKKFGRLDALINNAGALEEAVLGMITSESANETLSTNLLAPILHIQAASRIIRRSGEGGTIINMSSVSGTREVEGQVAYSAAKAGLIGATVSSAKELAQFGITVNAVAPGVIDTPLHKRGVATPEILSKIRMGRLGFPHEVADLCYFLASGQGRYITGQVVEIEGGLKI